ncbi:hypothetical protein TNCV_1843931 [Trichonephila clavipes]|nr:hypothetical protein TNCV_1843931 [Trichonephila clavipes]
MGGVRTKRRRYRPYFDVVMEVRKELGQLGCRTRHLTENPEGPKLANMVAKNDANLEAKNDANLALPRFRQVLIESPL